MTNKPCKPSITATFLALGGMALGACSGSSDEQQQQQQQQQPQQQAQLEVGEVTDNAAQYYGKTVELRGEVDDVFGAQAFELESEGFFEDDLLVLGKAGAAVQLQEDNEVKVNGTLRQMVVADIEREIGWDLDREVEIEYENKLVLVADSVEVTKGDAQQQQQDQQAQASGSTITDVQTLAQVQQQGDPQQILGRTVRLQNVDVRTVNSDKTFWIGPSHTQQVFVALGDEPVTPNTKIEGKVDVNEGRQATLLTGTIAAMPSLDEAKKQWNLDQKTLDVLKNQKFYIKADRVEMGQQS